MAIGTAYIKIMPEAKGISGEIAGVTDPAAEAAGKSGGGKWSSAFKKVLAVAGIGAAVGKALFAGADLQQSIGGIETLYKDSADKMMAYANQAYKTAGISANDYMQQATSFSAALISSYNGDVNKAADATNKAMIDMADNANKMGTPLESIQMAYQGFAKQNYTMLDNLKLGYGGTKTEMERLLDDAEKITGVHYDINELGDVYDAIHVIQGEMGITGTTAEEAANTISGSIGMMKASWQDLLGNLALGNDIYPQVEALMESVIAVAKNVIPAVVNIVTGIPKVIIKHFPDIIKAVKESVTNASDYVKNNWRQWVVAVTNIVSNIGTTLIQHMPEILSKIKTILTNAISGIRAAMPGIINAVFTIIKNVGTTLIKNLPAILRAALNLAISVIKGLMNTAWAVIKSIVAGIIGTFSTFGSSIVAKIRSGLASVVNTIAQPFRNAWSTLTGIVAKIKGIFPFKIGSVVSGLSGAISKLTQPFQSARETLSNIKAKIKGMFPINFGRLFSGLKLPHISVSAGKAPWGIAGKGKLPHFSVDWYKKAENQPYMFTDATLFGAGEHNDEILYGRQQLMRDIAQATSGGGEITINVYGGQMDPKEIAEEVERRLIQSQNRRRLAWQ